MSAGKIFLCYRREDSAGHAGRIYDRLNQRFPGRVFMDVTGIGVGSRWAEVIEQTLGSCEVVVILIGRRWLERGPTGSRRIDDPEDHLRAEITTALRLKRKIVPLLVSGAAVPEPEDLPQDVAPILDWQALRIDDDDFDHDSSRLVKALERQLNDHGTDLRLEPAAMKHAEIRRLMASAESCIARGDWITAAQTLQSVLSLDKTHAEAATRLQFVQQHSAQAYKPETPPPPPKGHGHPGRWAALGALAAVAVILIVLKVTADDESSHFMPDPGPPFEENTSAEKLLGGSEDARDADPPEDPAPAAPPMAGEYALASYYEQGTAIPLSGAMRLVPIGEGRFQFETFVTTADGSMYQYHGVFEGQGANWTTTTQQTNDPTAVAGPIPSQVSFDGSTLIVHNSYGQSAVWQKHLD